MRSLDPALAAHIDSGVTTLCWCWRLTRRDGTVFGFTDHDRDLTFDSTLFEAAAGLTASELRDQVGLAAANVEIEGAVTSARLAEADLAAGLYDDATVEIFRVNWQAPAQRLLLRTGSLGEVRRTGAAFSAEVRGLAHYLQQPRGRLYQYTCDADLGDAHCSVSLDNPAYRSPATISGLVTARRFTITGLDAFVADWFSGGVATLESGAAAGDRFEIKRHDIVSNAHAIELWSEPPRPVAVGDTLTLQAGCDKRLETCQGRFANAVNFRGFPHMPGNDFITRSAREAGA